MRTSQITRWFLCAFLPVVMIPSNAGAAEPVIQFSVDPVLCIHGVLNCYDHTYTDQPRLRGSLRVFVLATNGVSAKVVFDASESYDPDGDPILITWSEDNGESEDTAGFFAHGPIVTNEFFIRPGEDRTGMSLTVSVNDAPGLNFGPPMYDIDVSVYTPASVLELVRETLEVTPRTQFTLTLWRMLSKALDCMNRGDNAGALHFLENFRKHFDRRPIGLSPTQVEGVRTATDLIAGILSARRNGD